MPEPLSTSQFFHLNFRRTDGVVKEVTLRPGQTLLLGRHLVCDVRLEGRKVSRRHVRFSYQADGRVYLADVGSHNGTFVNGVKVTETVLHGGEDIQVGEWRSRLEKREATVDMLNMPMMSPPLDEEDNPWDMSTGSAKMPDFHQLTGVHSHPEMGPESTEFLEANGDEDGQLGKTGRGWAWEVRSDTAEQEDVVRAAPMEDNPIVRRLEETGTNPHLSQLGHIEEFDTDHPTHTPTRSMTVDAVALQMVYRLVEALQVSASLDAFLAEMSESLANASRSNAVIVLLIDEETGELRPRVVKNRRPDEKIEISRTIVDQAMNKRLAMTTEDAATDSRFRESVSVLHFDLKAVLVVPLIKESNAIGALYLTRELPFSDVERDAVAALGHLIAMGLERARLREQVEQEERQRRALERFHAPDVVRRLMMEESATHSKRVDGLFLEPLVATVLFCDLSGFTSYCETHNSEAVGKLLNSYLGRMTEVVFSHGGTVDKYIGDAVMCIFGAPFTSGEDALRAVRCAIQMRRSFKLLLSEISDLEDVENLKLHIGVNTGRVVAGTVGSTLRMEYTALGDTVNIAARLESFAKPGQIVIGTKTADVVKNQVQLTSLGQAKLKGKRESIEVFEVLDGKD